MRRRLRPTLKPSTEIVSKAQEFVDIYRFPPQRPSTIYPTPQVDKPAAKCRKDVCLLPDCNCGGPDIPGRIFNPLFLSSSWWCLLWFVVCRCVTQLEIMRLFRFRSRLSELTRFSYIDARSWSVLICLFYWRFNPVQRKRVLTWNMLNLADKF